jgi:potassium-transporting ATPase KdpC subunit
MNTNEPALKSAGPPEIKDSTLRHLSSALLLTLVTVVLFGLVYPFAMTALAQLMFPAQANGSMVYRNGAPVGSSIIGQLWTKPQYFHGRPSAAGKGYDPTSTGATNLGPTSKKLIDATKAAIAALRKENPDATGAIPMDLVTSSASGIDPDISPEAAYYQAPRVAKARGMPVAAVTAVVDSHMAPRTLGFLGEPRVNVLELNLALDAVRR